jgi:hypothetical protein
MFRNLVVVAVLAILGLAAYNFVSTGQLGLSLSDSRSPEERQVAGLEERLNKAGRQLSQASRAAGISGMDMTADANAALREIEAIEKNARALRQTMKDAKLRARLDGVLAEARRLKGRR